MEDKIYEIEEQIKELETVFDYLYLPEKQYDETTQKINELKLELVRLENAL